MEEKCGRCKFFNGSTKRPRKGFKVRYGICRRFPPITANIWQKTDSIKYVPAGYCYPVVHSDMYCGEYFATS